MFVCFVCVVFLIWYDFCGSVDFKYDIRMCVFSEIDTTLYSDLALMYLLYLISFLGITYR
ncbi:hypothetical protein CCS92_34525 [Methylobacterium radiotolerans]|nr:hypothetical protein CCS92_34525 [Methylobacterium radiotolerans]